MDNHFIDNYLMYILVIILLLLVVIYVYKKSSKNILVTQYYIPKWDERKNEINECLINNLQNPLLDEIHLFVEKEYDFSWIQSEPNFYKIKLIPTDKRLSYKTAIDHSNNLSDHVLSRDNKFILANSDIYFDESLSFLDSLDINNTFLALTRHEIKDEGLELYERPSVSQDVWIWKSKLDIKNIPENEDYFNDGIELGIWGCDNRILKIVSDSGYKIRNIGKNIRCIHNHKNDLRTWATNPNEVKKRYWSPGKFVYLDCE